MIITEFPTSDNSQMTAQTLCPIADDQVTDVKGYFKSINLKTAIAQVRSKVAG